jgi:hypothetical protein
MSPGGQAFGAVFISHIVLSFFSTGVDRAFKLGHYPWLNTLDEPTIWGIISSCLTTIIGKENGTRERSFKAKRARKERRDAKVSLAIWWTEPGERVIAEVRNLTQHFSILYDIYELEVVQARFF